MPCCDQRSRAGGKRFRRNGRARLLYLVEPTTLAHPPPQVGREGWGARGPRRLAHAPLPSCRLGRRAPPPRSSPTSGEEASYFPPPMQVSTFFGVQMSSPV